MGDEDRAQEGRVRPFFPLGCGWLGGLWADRVSSLGFITYHYVGANTGVSPLADVRSRSRPRSLHVSQTLLRCLDRSVNCGDYSVILGYTRKSWSYWICLTYMHYMRPLAKAFLYDTQKTVYVPAGPENPQMISTDLLMNINWKSCPPSSACSRISRIYYSNFGYGRKIGGISRSVPFSALSCFIQLATLQVHIESYLQALEATQS